MYYKGIGPEAGTIVEEESGISVRFGALSAWDVGRTERI